MSQSSFTLRRVLLGCVGAAWLIWLSMVGQPSSVQAQTDDVFPRIMARLPLAGDGAEIQDFRRNPLTGDLYITDTAGHLYVVSGQTLTVTATLAVGGELAVDVSNQRLYVMPGNGTVPGDQTPTVQVISLETMEISGEIPGARYVALDPEHGRIFSGSPLSSYVPSNKTPVRVYDMDSLEQVNEFDVVGIPEYLPDRDEVVIVSYTALVYDPDTQEVLAELLPQLEDVPFRWCNGCDYAERAHYIADDTLLAIDLSRSGTGPGPGYQPPTVYFDAATLEPLAETETQPVWQATCSSQPHIQWPVDGKRYINESWSRYVFYWNFRVETETGELMALRDGLHANFVNPNTGQAIVDANYVIDLESLEPIGSFPAFCWLDYDQGRGLLYGKQAGTLLVMAEEGGTFASPPSAEPSALPTQRISRILASPAYAQDQTAFVVANGNALYRTRDGGESWMHLRGGLPEDPDLALDVALSPDFASDQTIYAGGAVRTYRGEGVLRSQDGGDTWFPLWKGMDYLRVHRVTLSPTFAEDDAMAAYSDFTQIDPWVTGSAIYTSTDRGLSWALAYTDSYASDLPTPEDLWQTQPLPVRIVDYGRGLEVQADDASWHAVPLVLADGEALQEVVPSPTFPQDQVVYVRGRSTILRTGDRGRTWQRWVDPRLDGRTYENELSALAAIPLADGGHELWVGTAAGELWKLRPVAPQGTSQPAMQPTVRPTTTTLLPTPTSTAVAPEAAATPSAATAEPLGGTPPDGFYRPTGAFASLWEADPGLQQALGWAIQDQAAPMQAAVQEFQRGDMIWRGDNATIYVIERDGMWKVYDDTFEEGEPESDAGLIPPRGLLQPMRGFGKLWRSVETLQTQLGWAKSKEQGYGGFVQEFEHGLILSGGDRTRILIGAGEGTVWQ